MADFPGDLKYAETHEWARIESDGTVTVGIGGRSVVIGTGVAKQVWIR